MQNIKLFLASSAELKADRDQFEIFIYRKCKDWYERGLFLHLDLWEDLSSAMAVQGSQSEYNKVVQGCDIFVLLAFNKVGMYTAEEFGEAFGQFSQTQKPFIFTYFKTPPTTQDRNDLQSLWAFQDKLQELQHFKTDYQTIEGLREHFGNQLDKLAASDFKELAGGAAESPAANAPPGAVASGEGSRVYQATQGSTITDSSKTYNIRDIENARFE